MLITMSNTITAATGITVYKYDGIISTEESDPIQNVYSWKISNLLL